MYGCILVSVTEIVAATTVTVPEGVPPETAAVVEAALRPTPPPGYLVPVISCTAVKE
jgi:hypothetical protein